MAAVISNTSTSTGMLATFPIDQRRWPLRYVTADGATVEEAYPINYEELYNLKGRLLTLVDATFTDPEQRKAHKDLVWQTLRAWMDSIAHSGQSADETSHALKASASAAHEKAKG